MLLCSTGNIRQDRHKSRMIYNALQQREKETVLEYYTRTEKAIATQLLTGQKPDPDEDQAMDFIYKLDHRLYKGLIQKMDWDEEDAMRCHAAAKKLDTTVIFTSSYPNTYKYRDSSYFNALTNKIAVIFSVTKES